MSRAEEPLTTSGTFYRSTQIQTPYGKYPEIVVYSTPEQRTADMQRRNEVHLRLQAGYNKGLIDCYRNAMTAYNSTSAERSPNQADAEFPQNFGPFRVDGATGGVASLGLTGTAFINGYKNPLVSGAGTNSISIAARGGVIGGIKGVGRSALGKAGVAGILISATGGFFQVSEYVVGREAALRNIIADCNRANPNATSPISPWSTYLSSHVNRRIGSQ